MLNEGFLQALSSLNLAIAAGVGVLVAHLLMRRQQRRLKLLIGAFYALIGYCLLICWMARSGLMEILPALLYSNYIPTFALGPMIYIYTELLLNRELRLRSIVLMFLPAFLMLVGVAVYHIGFPGAAALAARRDSPFPSLEEPVLFVACALAELSFSFYFALSGVRVGAAARDCSRELKRRLRRFSFLYLLGSMTYLAVAVGHLMRDDLATMIASVANGFSILAYFLYIHQCPEATLRPLKRPAADERREIRSGELASQEVATRLDALMTRSRLYREPELDLASLSAKLGIGAHQLSLVLNDRLGVNFRAYVNAHRLEEAKLLLASDEASSILDIAFRVGFNSKTSFNTLFVQETGMTPKEFRQRFGAGAER